MQVEQVSYQDGVTALKGTLFSSGGASRKPGVLVFPDILGLGEHARERAERLAGLGYAALAVDIHGDGKILPMDEAMKELGVFLANPDVPRGRAQGALRFLREQPGVDPGRIAAIGFCFGGTIALELARLGAPLLATVGFHSTLTTSNPDGASKITGKVLACIGSEDPAVPAEQRVEFEKEMRSANIDWQLQVYGGVYHSFTDKRSDDWGNPSVARYDADADRRSWAAMHELLDDAFFPA